MSAPGPRPPSAHRRFRIQPPNEPRMASRSKYQLDITQPPNANADIDPSSSIPETTIERLGLLVYELGLPSRASLLRRCINRQLQYSEKHEVRNVVRSNEGP